MTNRELIYSTSVKDKIHDTATISRCRKNPSALYRLIRENSTINLSICASCLFNEQQPTKQYENVATRSRGRWHSPRPCCDLHVSINLDVSSGHRVYFSFEESDTDSSGHNAGSSRKRCNKFPKRQLLSFDGQRGRVLNWLTLNWFQKTRPARSINIFETGGFWKDPKLCFFLIVQSPDCGFFYANFRTFGNIIFLSSI